MTKKNHTEHPPVRRKKTMSIRRMINSPAGMPLLFALTVALWTALSSVTAHLLRSGSAISEELMFPASVAAFTLLFALFLVPVIFYIRGITAALTRSAEERERADKHIRKTEERFGEILTNIDEYIYSVKIEKNKPVESTHSPKCLDITGYTPEEMTADINLWMKIIHPDDLDSMIAYFRSTLKLENPSPIEHRIICRTGKIKWVSNFCLAGKNKSGTPNRLIGYIHDITPRKKNDDELKRYREHLEELVVLRTSELAEANRILKEEIAEKISVESQLKKSEVTLRALIEAARDAVFLETLSGEIINCNAAAARLYGYTTEEFTRLTVKDLIPDGIDINLEDVIKVQLETGGFSSVVHNKKKDGTVFPCEVSTKLLTIEGTTLVAAFVRDITAGVEAEEEIKLLNTELRLHILELQELNKELEAFNYSVSHDLKSPLITISGYARIILKKFSSGWDPEAVRLMNIIQLNSLKMEQLIKDLLTLSHTGAKMIECSHINIGSMAETVFEDVAAAVPERSIKLIIQDPPRIFGDPRLIVHVIMNLVSNAVKFTANKKFAEIEIGGWKGDSVNVIYIRDNGVGFEMKHSEQVFDAFFRIHSRDEFEGTGIGLSIVKRIISRHGGRVWVKSKPKKGTTFYFSLPERYDQQAEETTEEESPAVV